MAPTSRSCVTAKKFSFSVQIEKFSWQLRRDAYVSSKHYCELTHCNWSLIIEPVSESYFTSLSLPPFFDYIRINLKRDDYKIEFQPVDVHLTIVDYFNICPFYASKEICFTGSFNEDVVLRVKKSELCHSYWGLSKLRFTPNDILTVKCDITVYETREKKLANDDELEGSTKHMASEIFVWLLKVLGLILAVFYAFSFSYRSGISVGYVLFEFIVLWYFVKVLWYITKPGGDRTHDEPHESNDNETKREMNNLNK